MNSSIQQVITIVGVLAGAIVSFVATSLIERAKWRRLKSSRWDEKRLYAYVEYAGSVKYMISLAWRVSAARGLPSSGQPMEIEEGLRMISDAEDDRGRKWESVLMLGDGATISAARKWHECAWKLEWFARGKYTDPDDFRKIFDQSYDARDEFYLCARADLGVSRESWPSPKGIPEWADPRNQSLGAP
jgi:hypothetical protein